ncbi:polysaccharide pyruvyl transferase family protein [Microbacterium sp. MPKO10]|uniref:polysaccharide pyruvyl transferase family protein n=1 Tax=Microbacterium sp. MPKO10 TaxID=2989818 RepID=UPI0022368C9D|nr:polysaccharide pyruvyl transferase family protein [Microbacterium sp. MPKO10]MCW4458874.1 polysaccharide pyruvyl transferase family protein [Microbacterium sp. MPKO10]
MCDSTLYPRAPLIEAYWWDGHPNFGDALTPWLLRRRGIIPVHAEFPRAKVVGVGSLIQFIPAAFTGLIWGSGLISDAPVDLPRTEVLAVRGPLTREAIGAVDSVVLGDPGLLASRMLPRPRVRYRLGIVPHGSHFENSAIADFAAQHPAEVTVIDVARSPTSVIREIASCAAIVSTSLHGVIIADSYGIPACWTMVNPLLIGGDFKFLDHEAVVNPPGRTRRFTFAPDMTVDQLMHNATRADPDRVSAAIRDLERSVAELRLRFASNSTSPLRSWEALVARKV